MFNWKEFEKIEQILSHMGGGNYKAEWGQHHLHVRPNDLLDWMEFLKDDLGFFTVAEIAGRKMGDSQSEVVYHLLNMGLHQRLNLHLLVEAGEIIPSMVPFFSHADWPEREQAEILNLTFDRERSALILPEQQKKHPLKKDTAFKSWPPNKSFELPKLRFNPNKSEAPYPEEKYQWKKFDILSPMTLGNFEWDICFDPERVVESFIQIGFHHQGLERLLENKDIFQILQLVDKVNLSSAPNYSIAWSRTIEEMFRIKVPERAQAIRIVMLELARIAQHLGVLHAICYESGQDEYRHFLNAREKVYELFEKFSGHRHCLGVSRIGGVKEDLPHGWVVEYQSVSEVLSKNLVLVHNSLLSQVKFRELLAGESVNAQAVLQWGVGGPAMRAAGLNFDLRKSQPFYFYQDIDFDIPVGINGAAYDRYLIRYEEIFQSLRIITQVIDNLPLGAVVAENFDNNYLELCQLFATLEQPREWHYSSLESPAGEAGFLVNFGKDLRPSRLKLKTPGFSLAAALPIFMKGLREDQLRPSLASLGLSRWEMDR
jgi:NADH-quinone oxidoreductase subunit C/D